MNWKDLPSDLRFIFYGSLVVLAWWALIVCAEHYEHWKYFGGR